MCSIILTCTWGNLFFTMCRGWSGWSQRPPSLSYTILPGCGILTMSLIISFFSRKGLNLNIRNCSILVLLMLSSIVGLGGSKSPKRLRSFFNNLKLFPLPLKNKGLFLKGMISLHVLFLVLGMLIEKLCNFLELLFLVKHLKMINKSTKAFSWRC